MLENFYYLHYNYMFKILEFKAIYLIIFIQILRKIIDILFNV